jgi:hypothetical protein
LAGAGMFDRPKLECSCGLGRRAQSAVARMQGGIAGGSALLAAAGVLAWLGRECSLGRGGSARLAGQAGMGVLALPGRYCSLGQGWSARLAGAGLRVLAWPAPGGGSACFKLAGEGVLAWPGRECSLGRGGSARLAGEGVLAGPGRECCWMGRDQWQLSQMTNLTTVSCFSGAKGLQGHPKAMMRKAMTLMDG